MNAHERFAVEHFLCSYPKAYSYQDVLNALNGEDPDDVLEAWAHIARVVSMPSQGYWIAEEIETLRAAMEHRFTPITYANETEEEQ
jgi:hypothetical protein